MDAVPSLQGEARLEQPRRTGAGTMDQGVPGYFGFFFVLVILIGIGTTVFRVSAARSMAKDAGLDENRAAGLALLDKDGLSATYLASSLRHSDETPTPASPHRTVEERLNELDGLRDRGLVTPEEYDARRRAILDSL